MATAALLALAIFITRPMPPSGPILSARLEAEAQALAFAARLDAGTGLLTVTRVAGTPPDPGQDLQLWAIGADGVPVSLGLIQQAEVTRPAEGLAPGVVLAVSLEPAGGSTTGAPTGPVLVTGVLTGG
jgi:anti-sigma-K factor RskA